MTEVTKWGVWQTEIEGPSDGNPFTEQWVRLKVESRNESAEVDGFYDGDGRYIARFMPSFEGEYSYELTASFLSGKKTGTFTVLPARPGNHGPVRVQNTWALAYSDGTPYISIGTTCYVWHLQSDELIEQTFETLSQSAFNKIRFCVFPKHYVYNLHEPRSYPYEGTPMDSSVLTKKNFNLFNGRAEGNDWDLKRFNPAHFRHLEKCVERLGNMGIEADIILFHPYDRWGFSLLTPEEDLLYVRYIVSRLSAYHNVWWSLANEYDLMKKSDADWLSIAHTICEKDPYRHMRSIHNCRHIYDFSRPWCTHCSIQRTDTYSTVENTDRWRDMYRKPVVMDEIAYEGDIQFGWGNITGEEMLRRFWETALRGGYPGHGETMTGYDDILWWSHGGKLHGESHKRFAFLMNILKRCPGNGLKPNEARRSDEVSAVPLERQYAGKFYLYYYSFMRPYFREFHLNDETEYEAYVLDTWEMKCDYAGTFKGEFRIDLPKKQYMGIMLIAK
ncbi:MAG: DUF5605 domain-containing protein [Clostridia bacterium]|nr:DUF5605 domain-containing protein [Clostridia bacterium]